MRIALVMSVFNKQGGISRYVTGLAEQFVKEHEVHLICSKYETDIPNAHVHRHRILWRPPSLQVASNALANYLDVRRLRREVGFDIVHSQGAECFSQDIICAQSCQKAAVEHLRAERGGMYRLLKPFEPRSNIVLAIEGHNYGKKAYKRIISVSQGVKREIMEQYGVPDEDIAVIPNGVDLEEFKPQNKESFRGKIRGELGLDESDVVLVFTAWEFNRKGLRYIIEALPKTGKNVKLLAVGGDNQGPYRDLAQKMGVKDRVVFTGHKLNVREYYAAADIFVFPTAYEAFSLSTLEAAASGLPVLAAKVNGTEELIKDGVNGFFITRDGADIADKIRQAQDAGLDRMGAQARKTALGYSWENIASATLKVYEQALG